MALILVNMAMKISGSNKSDARWARGKMCTNIAINFGIGLFPVLGDIADIFYRCNCKNADLLEDLLYRRVKQAVKASREKAAVRIENPNNTGTGTYHNPEVVQGMRLEELAPPPRAAVKPILPNSRRYFGTNRKGSAQQPDVEKGEAGLTQPIPSKEPDTHNSWL